MAWFPCIVGGGGGGSTLITKSITQNGTYYAQDDGADGYSEVNVNVSGGGGGGGIFIPEYTETKILDNSAGSLTTITFDEDWHNYSILRIVTYNSGNNRYYSVFVTPEGITAAFTYSSGRLNINEVLNTGAATNQYCTYTQDSSLVWRRAYYRNLYIYEIYGLTFTNCTLQKTIIYDRQGIGTTTVAPTPPTGRTFFDYDALIYMSCTSDSTETQFGPTPLTPPKTYFQAIINPLPFYRYNYFLPGIFTPSSIGTQQYFHVEGLNFIT